MGHLQNISYAYFRNSMTLRLSSVIWVISLDHSIWPYVHSVSRTKTLILSLRQIKEKQVRAVSLVKSRRKIRYTIVTMVMRWFRWGSGVRIPLENFNLLKSHNKITKLPIPPFRKSVDLSGKVWIGAWWLYTGIESICYAYLTWG